MIKIKSSPLASSISAVSFEGYAVTGPDGQPARLAIIDDAGNVLDAGPAVEAAAWNVAIESHRQFMIGLGHLRVHSGPVPWPGKAAA